MPTDRTPQETTLELRKFVAPEIVFGADAGDMVGRYARNFGMGKVLLVTDPGVIRAGWCARAEASLKEASVPYVIFDGVTSNPKDHEVRDGTALFRRERCDALVAVGGGSPIDCAKGIGIMASNDRDILAFEGIDAVELPAPPLICTPTTAGTSADVSQFAIITDTVRKAKIAIVSKAIVPDVSLVDPVRTTTMPEELTANTGIDALTHAFEAYVSTAASFLTDLTALAAVQLSVAHFPQAVGHPLAMEHRGPMMMASLLAGLAFSNASLGLLHAMAHALGGLFDQPHGLCNAILLRRVVAFNFPAAVEKYARLGEALGVDGQTLGDPPGVLPLTERLASLEHQVGLDRMQSHLHFPAGIANQLAVVAAADPCLVTNPRDVSVEELQTLFEEALSAPACPQNP